MGKYFVWQCPKCFRQVKWDGGGEKPDTGCRCDSIKATLFRKGSKAGKRTQMPLKEMPK